MKSLILILASLMIVAMTPIAVAGCGVLSNVQHEIEKSDVATSFSQFVEDVEDVFDNAWDGISDELQAFFFRVGITEEEYKRLALSANGNTESDRKALHRFYNSLTPAEREEFRTLAASN